MFDSSSIKQAREASDDLTTGRVAMLNAYIDAVANKTAEVKIKQKLGSKSAKLINLAKRIGLKRGSKTGNRRRNLLKRFHQAH